MTPCCARVLEVHGHTVKGGDDLPRLPADCEHAKGGVDRRAVGIGAQHLTGGVESLLVNVHCDARHDQDRAPHHFAAR